MGQQWKIPQEELDRIKQEVSVADLAQRRGVKLEPHGKDLIGLCPFHLDHSPSLVVTPDKNLWHCLGACQAGGDVIAWVMRAEGVKFRHAIELLRRHDVALTPANGGKVVKNGTIKKLPAPVEHTADDHLTLRQVVEFYHETLKESPEALAYLEQRRIGHAGAIEQFRLGYANRTLGYRLPDRNRQAGAELRGRLMKLGVYRASGHEHFNGSVVVPVMDEAGVVTEMYGRKIRDDLREGTAYHLYLPGPHKGVWNISSLAAGNEVILCEALIDALTFWCAGFRNVTASYGVEGFTPDHLDAFKRYHIEKVLIAYDRDEAGDKATAKLAPVLIEAGLEVFRVNFPMNQDANDFARAVADPADAFGQLLHSAAWLGKGQLTAVAAKEKISQPLAAMEAPPVSAQQTSAQSPQTPPASEKPTDPALVGQVDEVFDGRAWRIRGVEKNTVYGVLRVSVRVAVGARFHLDTVDVANARHRAQFLKATAQELGMSEAILKEDMCRLLVKLEEIQDALIQKKLKPPDPVVTLTDSEKAEAMEFLKSPDLLDRIVKDFEAIGIVGEPVNALTGYLSCVSRKFLDPLAIIIQSSSAAGKSALMDAILSLIPEEEREKFTAVTGQALFYMGEKNLKHKILAVVEEQGAEKATYALKLLQSEGRLSIISTGKDPQTGKHVTFEYKVEGPVVIFITTTNIEVDEELLNRVLVLTINEDREQTRRIHDLQRLKETLDGVLRQERRTEILRRHQNAQRLLRPLRVVNPYAPRLTFLDTHLRTRRDHPKYLTLIRSIALLHQYQRPTKQAQDGERVISYIEVTPEDIAAANYLANAVIGRSLDELPAQTRRLLMLIDQMVTTRSDERKIKRTAFRFSRRDLREFTGWSDTTLKLHVGRLTEMEYLIVHRGRGQSFEYELIYDGQGKDGRPFCMGLIDVAALKETPGQPYDGERSGPEGQRSGCGRPEVGGQSGGGRDQENSATSTPPKASTQKLRDRAKTQFSGGTQQPSNPIIEKS